MTIDIHQKMLWPLTISNQYYFIFNRITHKALKASKLAEIK